MAVTAFGIVSVNVGRPSVLLEWPTGDVISSIDKRPVNSADLWLNELNLEGDEQADTRPTPDAGQVHCGPHQAVYAYPVEHYARDSTNCSAETSLPGSWART